MIPARLVEDVRSAASGGSGRPVAPRRTEPPAEEARVAEAGLEPATYGL